MNNATRTYVGMAILIVAVATALLYFYFGTKTFQTVDPTSAIPSNAHAVLIAEMEAIRTSPYASLLSPEMMSSLETMQQPCTKEIWNSVAQVAIWQPTDRDMNFALAAHVPMSADAFRSCSKQTISERDGGISIQQQGKFYFVEDPNLGKNAAQIAFRNDGLLLMGQPIARTMMIDTLGKRTESFQSSIHHRMRQQLIAQLGANADITLTVLVTDSLRNTAAWWIGETDSLLDGVNTISVGARMGKTTTVRAELACNNNHSCSILAQRLSELRKQALNSVYMRLLGVASIAQQLEIQAKSDHLSMLLSAPSEQIRDILQRISMLQQDSDMLQHKPAAPRHTISPPNGAPLQAFPQPDETLHPNVNSDRRKHLPTRNGSKQTRK